MTEPRVEAGDRALETASLVLQHINECINSNRVVTRSSVAVVIQSAMNAQERELREALRKIAENYGGCRCHHDTSDCCENPAVGEFCPHCIAEIALANSGAERGEGPRK